MKILKLPFFLLSLAGFGFFVLLFLGYWLSPQGKLVGSDAIVAISGGQTNTRAEEAVLLYQQGLAPVLVFSGAALDTSGPSNAQAMRQVALRAGVPNRAIILEEDATTTTENALGVAKIASQMGWRKVILVTSPYHQRRAQLEFSRHLKGQQIISHSSTDEEWRRSKWWATPKSTNLTLQEVQKLVAAYILGT